MNGKTIPIEKDKDYLSIIVKLLDPIDTKVFKRRWYDHDLKKFWEPSDVSVNRVIKGLEGKNTVEYVCYDVERTIHKKFFPEFFDILP